MFIVAWLFITSGERGERVDGSKGKGDDSD
jgi:hypothetical protein